MAGNTFAWRNSVDDIVWLRQVEVSQLRREGRLANILGFQDDVEMLDAQERVMWTEEQIAAHLRRAIDPSGWNGDRGGGALAL